MYECNLCKKIWHRRCGKQEGLPCKGAIANEWSCKQCTRATKTTTNSPTIGARTPQNKTKGQARTPPRLMGERVQHNHEMQKDANKQQTHGMYAHNNSTTNACSYSSTSSCDEQGDPHPLDRIALKNERFVDSKERSKCNLCNK